MAQVLLTDIGGVFYRGWPTDDFWPRWSARTGLDRPELEAWLSTGGEADLARLGRISAADYYRRAAERWGTTSETFRAMLEEAYMSDFNVRFAGFVRDLTGRGVTVWALTNSLAPEAEWMSRPGFEGMFRGVISSCDLGVAKPDPEIFRLALDRVGAHAGEIVYVDDIAKYAEAARETGMRAIHFQTTEQAMDDITAFFD
ncbi:HAD family hydrolase [Phenylobacterium aquaticum]|uniref:HAD family hydrolase n=1 Tax=Phenylobacterium aquaticum TaxID=1763816 RepID=UPI001F5E298B|nr:HAD family phosphatase [Phenylobacterium aquaticum]MCI3135006.1 HAD family phosphatase [Phenylobacterium aquaticum]